MGYGVSKGAFHRVAGFLAVELADQGIRCFNVQPGLIATERIGQDMAKHGIPNHGAPAEVVAKVVTWLATDPEADAYNGANIEAPYFCHERGTAARVARTEGARQLDPLRHLRRRPRQLREAEQGPPRRLNATGRLPTAGCAQS